ncbi:50S ribosomal protein L4 [Caldilinea sp.]|mgnify:FL=1|uniref:50S ribosomal protein L4 n=1 Tax=Caldilinea sp. TaxID=2293560 RepID=UPI002C7A6507|nr:50S ribosomal protein L4 [Anaerolineales bacterium]HQY94434.1 50S ribosomal protein L4 [Caldilinea sp.]HRA66358.1 50S ribosomal protein L4 [Caldilinea sp.]
MLIPVKNMSGQQVGEVELSDAVFAAPINTTVMHQALMRQLSNARLGTHDTKVRSEVSGGGKKPWRQKGTGRARQGSTRAPNWVGGGAVFGPTPRKYTKSLPKKMQRLALRGALSVKVANDQMIVLDQLAIDAPKTKTAIKMLSALGADGRSVLLVAPEKNIPVWKSVHNIPQVRVLQAGYLNIRDLLGYDLVVLTRDAVDAIELWLGADAPSTTMTGAAVTAPEMTEA